MMAQENKEKGEPAIKTELPQCFVIMPISEQDTYGPEHFRDVYDHLITPACKANGYKAVRADDIKSSHIIHVEILKKLVDCPMAICDLSSRNPNVLFELGLRQAFDRPTLIIQEKNTKQIFDTTIISYTEYRSELIYKEVLEDQRRISIAFAETLEASKDPNNSNSIVNLLSISKPAQLKDLSQEQETNSLLKVMMNEIATLKRSLVKPTGLKTDLFGNGIIHRRDVQIVYEDLLKVVLNKAENIRELMNSKVMKYRDLLYLFEQIVDYTHEEFKKTYFPAEYEERIGRLLKELREELSDYHDLTEGYK